MIDMNLSQIENDQLQFARLAEETARRTGDSTITNPKLIRCNDTLRLLCMDVGGETVTHGIELPANAWSPALEAELLKRFQGSAQLAVRAIGGTRYD